MHLTLLGTLALAQTAVNPWNLPIDNPQTIPLSQGVFDSRGQKTTPASIAQQLDGTRFVLFGESHDNTDHKKFCAELVDALVARGRNVSIGLEMFTRPAQRNLAPWSMGKWTEEEFIEKSNWKTEWGFDFAIYRPLFERARAHRLPLVALNVPRDWVRAVGRGGPEALPAEAKGQVPPFDPTYEPHRQFFQAMIGGHPMADQRRLDNMISAQVLWDVGMADSALKWVDQRPQTSGRIMLILAGSGHAGYQAGINYRITQRSGERVPTIIGLEGASVTVSSTLGDWFVVTPSPAR